MDSNDFIHEPDDKEIEMMLEYVPAYSAHNGRNIKKKFEEKVKTRHRRVSFKKLVLAGAAASMVFVTTLVSAQVIDIVAIYRMIFGENSGYIEQYIEYLNNKPHTSSVNETRISSASENNAPIPIQSEYDGVIIKLISAINDENSLRIFATVTDTTGDRLDESIDLTWGISQGNGGGFEVIDYNNETKMATVMITSLGDNEKGDATLWVRKISNDSELFKNLPETSVHIGEIVGEHTPNIISQDEVWTNGGVANNRKLFEESHLLKPDEVNLPFDNTEIFSISNVGFVDGRLHIQAKTTLERTALTDGYYINTKFLNLENEVIFDTVSRVDFTADKKYAYQEYAMEPHDVYSEMIYDGITSPNQLDGLTLAIDYIKYPEIIEGSWEISFTIPEKVTTEFQIDRDLLINGEEMRIDMLSLSPLGITLHLPKDLSENYAHSDIIFIEYDDGAIVEMPQSSIRTYEGNSILVFEGQIIEIEKVREIIINDESIDISR